MVMESNPDRKGDQLQGLFDELDEVIDKHTVPTSRRQLLCIASAILSCVSNIIMCKQCYRISMMLDIACFSTVASNLRPVSSCFLIIFSTVSKYAGAVEQDVNNLKKKGQLLNTR